MSQIDKKVKWCLNKAKREIEENKIHRGLLKIEPDIELARKHIIKAEHNLKAIIAFKEIGFSDWSASASFYAIYHSLLAIISKWGYESRNQECTFALVYQLINENEINLNINLIQAVHLMNPDENHDLPTIIEQREIEQYGVSVSIEDKTYNRLLNLAKEILDKVKLIIEE